MMHLQHHIKTRHDAIHFIDLLPTSFYIFKAMQEDLLSNVRACSLDYILFVSYGIHYTNRPCLCKHKHTGEHYMYFDIFI